LATNARFPSKDGESAAVRLGDGVLNAAGTTGEIGTGVYSIDEKGECLSTEVLELLVGLREKGAVRGGMAAY